MLLVKNALLSFNRITLSDLDQVKLMDRTDKKFCLQRWLLPDILGALKNDYSLLEIKGETIFSYQNLYYDTVDDQMFINHQNGKRNRFKIRVRQYLHTNDNFLEIKFKNNKGRTIKERIARPDFHSIFKETDLAFIQKSLPYPGAELLPKIRSNFDRITLVDNNFTERVTIDTIPVFKTTDSEIILENLVIIEVKQSKANRPALITQVLGAHKIRRQGFSKYCIGRSLLEENIKKNNFKPLLLRIRKEYLTNL